MSRYEQEFRRSLTDPEGFWGDAAKDIDWYQAPTVVLDRSRPPFYRWFADGVMNTCFNAVDRHVRDGRGQQPALIYDSPVTGTQRTSPTPSCRTRSRGSPGCCAASGWTRATG